MDEDDIGVNVRGLARLFGGPRAHLAEQAEAVAEFLEAVWNEDRLASQRLALASLLADHFFEGAPLARRGSTHWT